jgi:hypothetical protein
MAQLLDKFLLLAVTTTDGDSKNGAAVLKSPGLSSTSKL